MTNFLKMAHAISDLGYDVYIFKRFADGGKDDFIPQLSKIRTIFFINRQTGKIYTCSCCWMPAEKFAFGFAAIEYKAETGQVRYGYSGYVYWCQEDGTLDVSNLKCFLDYMLLDMDEVYGAKDTIGSSLFRTDVFSTQGIAHIALRLGFKLQYKI